MPRKHNRQARKAKHSKEIDEIRQLQARVDEMTELDPDNVKKFSDFPLSNRTLKGLTQAGFVRPTDIQKSTIFDGIKGKDVLGAAKTGSGKTLAFLVPVLERLYRAQWTKLDGVGALIISPTRELALQTYQCLLKVGVHHEMSAGLVIGGTTMEREAGVITSTNIIICTPGRLLQHMDETPLFNCDNLQVLVLDEADRILDLGFSKSLNAILQNIPSVSRQTLLFSATQTKSVKDLARLSLKDPRFANVHEKEQHATPDKLTQAYVVCNLQDKLDVLFSFIRTHTNAKTLVFVSSCKQVRFLYEALRRLRPGVPLMHLFGRQKQSKRVAVFKDFSKKKQAVLFATDIAARGLDFPAVDWVVQLDCPEDVETYIHRVGRTARFNRQGKALLVLLPSEEPAMAKLLKDKKIPVTKTNVNTKQLQSITPRISGVCAEDPSVKFLAQKCFISYMRSVFLQPNKDVFKVDELPTEEFAASLGLPSAPRIRFVKKKQKVMGPAGGTATASANTTQFGSVKKMAAADEDEEESESESAAEKADKQPVSKFDRLRQRTNQGVLSEAYQKLRASSKEEDDDDLLQAATKQTHMEFDEDQDVSRPKSKKERKKATKAALQKAELGFSRQHVVFNEEGEAVRVGPKLVGMDMDEDYVKAKVSAEEWRAMEEAKEKMEKEDALDKEAYKQKLRERKLKRKEKLRQLLGLESQSDSVGVQLGPASDSEGDGDSEGYEWAEDQVADSDSDSDEEGEDVSPPYDDSGSESGVDSDADQDMVRPKGKRKASGESQAAKRVKRSVADDEELALKLLSAQ